ncbi:hypothetical protein [Cupriavidus necator]
MAKMRPVRVPRVLPVLSHDEVARLLAAAGNLKKLQMLTRTRARFVSNPD